MAITFAKIDIINMPILEKETDTNINNFKEMISNYQQDEQDQILKKELLQARMMMLHRIGQYDKFEDKFSHQDGVQYMEILRLKLQHCLIETQYAINWENLSKSHDQIIQERQQKEKEMIKIRQDSERMEQSRERERQHSQEKRVQLVESTKDKNDQQVMRIQMSQQDYDEYMKFKHKKR